MHGMKNILAWFDSSVQVAEDLSRRNLITNEMGPRWRAGSLGAGIFLFMFGRL